MDAKAEKILHNMPEWLTLLESMFEKYQLQTDQDRIEFISRTLEGEPRSS